MRGNKFRILDSEKQIKDRRQGIEINETDGQFVNRDNEPIKKKKNLACRQTTKVNVYIRAFS